MATIVVGDRDRACLANNTSMDAFGPLHVAYSSTRNAETEMRDFIDSLPERASSYTREELNDKHKEWQETFTEDL